MTTARRPAPQLEQVTGLGSHARRIVRAVRRGRARRGLLGSVAMFALASVLVVPLPATAADAVECGIATSVTAADGFACTKTVTRENWVEFEGVIYPDPQSNTVTVSADKTTNLQGRERVQISWTGARPSAARAANPFGENGMAQEYPVVVMQCRGIDDPSLPADQQITPDTCWTSSALQRSQLSVAPNSAIWTRDRYADPANTGRLSGMDPFPTATECPTADSEGYYAHLTPFRAADGTVFPACDKDRMPPEAAIDAAFPPGEVAAFTDADGSGSVNFEVRSDVENESLGCNDKTACSVVVIPIMGISCDDPSTTGRTADFLDYECIKSGQFAAGSSNFTNAGVDLSVSPLMWWSASNWRNRISIPITFGLPPDACDILDPRAPTGFYGSELLAQASLQWSPAYCLNADRFKVQHNQMSDAAGFALMEQGGGVAAEVSSEHKTSGDPVAYAPTALTGFGIGYVIDKPENGGELTELKLNARLLAKLLTQSYTGSVFGAQHPGMADNPQSINLDPEFQALNPGLTDTAQEAAATVMSLSESSDVMEQLTDYIAHDPAALDFIQGQPDENGMVVNPSYKDIELPQAQWPLLDNFTPTYDDECHKANPQVYFNQIAAPVTKLNTIAQALIDGRPLVATRCDSDGAGGWKLGRIGRQTFGSRFLLGIVSLGDAERYGLRTAALETTAGTYVSATPESIARGVELMQQPKRLLPFQLDQGDIRTAGDAYPGTMVVYTAARRQNLLKEDAATVASFIRIASTEGQVPGSGNGQLPEGFVPIVDSGVTAKLLTAASQAADSIEAQKAPPPPTTAPEKPTKSGSGKTSPPATVGDPVAAEDPGTTPVTETPKDGATTATPVVSVPTIPVSSSVGHMLFPVLLGLGLLGGAAASALKFAMARRT